MSDTDPFPPIQTYLIVKGGSAAIEFYKRAFGAEETFRHMADDGKRVMHANLALFGGQIMLSDEFTEIAHDVTAPSDDHKSTVTIHINLASREAVDSAMEKAAKQGAEITMPADDMFWGARYGRLRDPFGHVWSFSSPHGEDKSGESA